MPRPQAECGTPAAYRRHLREKTPPCDPCRQAYSQARADERKRASKRQPTAAPMADTPAELAPRTSQTVADLAVARDVLMLYIQGDVTRGLPPAAPAVLPNLVRELREVRKLLDAASPEAAPASEEAVDEFTAAREARAARKAGA